jgi:hypothetical protein
MMSMGQLVSPLICRIDPNDCLDTTVLVVKVSKEDKIEKDFSGYLDIEEQR